MNERGPGDADGDGGDAASGRPEDRPDRVRSNPTPGPGNSLSGWWRTVRNPLRVSVNYALVWLIRLSPSLAVKRWLLRRLGATVEAGATLGLEATPDVFFPELITLREDAVVGYDATLLCHEFLQDEYRTGEVVVGERAMVGAGAIVLPGVEIGPDAQVAANSLVTRDVPAGATVAGVPATEMASQEIEAGSDGESGERAADEQDVRSRENGERD